MNVDQGRPWSISLFQKDNSKPSAVSQVYHIFEILLENHNIMVWRLVLFLKTFLITIILWFDSSSHFH